MHKIFLASKSPRRAEIISNAGFEYELISIDVEEVYPETLPAGEVAEYLATLKANALSTIPEDGLVLTADTIVILGDEILGKPINKDDARSMLEKLSGQKHLVITGVCIKSASKTISFSDVSEVHFASLSASEIEAYINTASPFDKAGSYGIQDGLGMVAVTKIVGSYFNIMGLPIHTVYEKVKNWDTL
ncbi:Maf family protein [Portibacter lacus]|uniref:dTTP/UTP pyrophosphatase n=1 Tax=Portibacter lacus TaxID=1099794 RepID=A0AA37SK90_9BACT|nr:Maf family nucleotide pyrophosphatase [Portibacter lacus]GLR15497.1 Maf-like protein [Portibacter lacus]